MSKILDPDPNPDDPQNLLGSKLGQDQPLLTNSQMANHSLPVRGNDKWNMSAEKFTKY